jgi:hypothetical protein
VAAATLGVGIDLIIVEARNVVASIATYCTRKPSRQ